MFPAQQELSYLSDPQERSSPTTGNVSASSLSCLLAFWPNLGFCLSTPYETCCPTFPAGLGGSGHFLIRALSLLVDVHALCQQLQSGHPSKTHSFFTFPSSCARRVCVMLKPWRFFSVQSAYSSGLLVTEVSPVPFPTF